MRGVEESKRESKNKYSEQSGGNQINNSKALGVMALIALLLLFQVVTFVVGKITKSRQSVKTSAEAAIEEEIQKKKDTLLCFNPNTVTLDTLQMLGFTQRQAQTILNYRAKGGVFRVKRDFAKMYVVDSAKYRQLSSYILLPDNITPKYRKQNSAENFKERYKNKKETNAVTESKSEMASASEKYKDKAESSIYGTKVKHIYKKREKLNLNKADSAQLVSLYGIGPYFARKILLYKASLGGSFADTKQLMEIDRFTPDKFSAIENRIEVKQEDVVKFSFWEVEEDFIKRHPYIGAYRARGVILFLSRNRHLNRLSGRELLEKMVQEHVLTQNIAQRLEKYVK